MSETYNDIIDLPHHVSKNRRPMPRESRAAQFAPFAALTGYDASVKEEARLTGKRLELTEDEERIMNLKMAYLSERLTERPTVRVTYFTPDEKKSGGSYVSLSGELNFIDEPGGFLIISGEHSEKTKVPLADIINVESDLFSLNLFEKF